MNTKLFPPLVRIDTAIPLTPALSPRERENRRPRQGDARAFHFRTIGRRSSLSLRERAGVRGKRTSENGAALIASRPGQRGVALVVTLILLVVITTLAVAFLALSTRETIAVSGASSILSTEYANDAALERAKSQLLTQMIARNANGAPNDIMGPELMVSVPFQTNRLNSLGMFTNPSPPVFIWINKAINNPSAVEDRFWVDLNRNLQLEPTGYVPDVNDAGQPILDGSGNPIVRWRVGDPQWIGLLRDPTQPHGKDNPFIARYAYLILPAGRSLDINWIHNQAIFSQNQFDGYFRNQGVGPWEMNLAAFLADVNPHYWNTNFAPNAFVSFYRFRDSTNYSTAVIRGDGVAFSDARELLCYRFPGLEIGNRNAFGSCRSYFAPQALSLNLFPFDSIDIYCNGPVAPFGSSAVTAMLADDEQANVAWPGSRSATHYFTIHDLWKAPAVGNDGVAANRFPPGFFTRLKAASARGNTEDRYTYYRILAQLGTDSVPERDERLNINYRNLTNDFLVSVDKATNNYSRSALATNLLPWTATEFFHTAVDRVLTNEFFPYGIMHVGFNRSQGRLGIPVYTNGSLYINGNPRNPPIYNPRIQQLLQMTVNIYEATRTNDPTLVYPNLPTVLRPIFDRVGNDIYIVRYLDETGVDLRSSMSMSNSWFELNNAPSQFSGSEKFYDIPILFGARKGIPNFNEFTMNTVAHFSRKIQVQKDPTLTRLIATNQMLMMSISNSFICEMWNSYSNFPNPQLAYPRPLELSVGVVSTSLLTNNNGFQGISVNASGDFASYTPLSWSNAYRLTRVMTNTALSPSVFYSYPPNGPGFKLFDQNTSANNAFERVGPASTNRWGLTVSNRVLCFLFDNGRLVDCYTSARMNSRVDLSRELDNAARGSASAFLRMWDPTFGIQNQISTSRGPVPNGNEWVDYADLAGFSTIQAATTGFEDFITGDSSTQQVMQAGFSPSIRILQVNSWEANDPLVHYTVYDLFGGAPSGNSTSNSATTRIIPRDPYSIYTNALTPIVSSPGYALGNKRYAPWGGVQPDSTTGTEHFRFAEKDPGMYSSDFWDFPTQHFPSLGWLGRVHRGTPWQTIYFKAPDPNYTMEDWALHTGAAFMSDTFPTNDWRLLDVFTAAIHPNATRGRLSINQTNPAAWSAVFASVPVTAALDTGSGFVPAYETNVQPSSVDFPLASIVESINQTRANVFGGQFKKLSEFMMVTNLTIGSPYFANFDPSIKQSIQFSLLDSDYERLPQQILSLVKLGEPRYVVYAWGQSLKPADYVPGIGIGIDAGTKLTRNYQITGELATRAVVRVEFERDQIGRSLFNRPHAVVENFNILPNE